ncbi:lactonase family protein [Opitutus terrae]|uniref:6-phosphogluconolactonase n=1 Tax=Opitutus terrae (strain DSM 11246 / JCM 15787 / PB90-1) TaxID=452637 RepID=B2A047_OPITP|nr:lactonase family protein [Opitutus terrae]ACB77383.1 6-phosphogluconolactonase [Opitutus terrae PB90-1]
MSTHHLFIGPYTRDGSKGIYALQLDAATGRLSDAVLAAETRNPSYLTLAVDRRTLYAVSESDAMAAAFAVGDDRVHLTALAATQAAGGKAPCHLAVDRTGRALLVANYHTGVVASLPINPDGSLRPPASIIHHTGSSVHLERQATAHAHCVTLSPDNRFVFVCDLGLDKIFIYRLDPGSAQLSPAEPPFLPTPAGSGPRHLTFAPDGRHAFLVTELGGTLIAYRYDAAHGTLTATDQKSTLAPDYRGENTSAAVRVHPLGRFVYASNRGPDNIAVFAFDEASERLALVELVPSGGQGPRDFALSPDGQWLVAAHQFSDVITVFRVDRSTGRLTPTPHRARVSTPVCVLFLD